MIKIYALKPACTALLAGTFLLSGSCLSADSKDAAETFSEANQLLFFEPHLQNIKKPQTLEYQFSKSGSLETGFEDHFLINIKAIQPDQSKTISVTYFTGERSRFVPDIERASGNPLLSIFMQRDVREMARMTGGHWRHFQKQIKLALENEATVSENSIEFNGEKVPAKVVKIQPYHADPFKQRFTQYLDKRYTLTLSDAVPGMIYRIETHVSDNKQLLLKEVVQYKMPDK